MDDNSTPDLLYGAAPIAAFLGLRERQARHRIATGQIPTFKIGQQICGSRKALTTWLAEQAAGRSTKDAADPPKPNARQVR